MLSKAFDLGEELTLKTIRYPLHPPLWSKYDISSVDLNIVNWNTIKYLNEACDDFSPEIGTLPNNKGGIYLFSIHCPIILGHTEFPAYVGRAQSTDNQNLRKRCREYFTKYLRDDERPKITRMIKYWGKYLYLNYFILDANDDTIDYEKKLINSLLLPFNDAIPDIEIRQAVKAF